MKSLRKARANFGVATPLPIQAAATVAWSDDNHVMERRKIFSERIDYAFARLNKIGLIRERPAAGFYLWCRLPDGTNDIDFCLELAEKGVITSPSQWLSEGIQGYIRLAMVPNLKDIEKAMDIIEEFYKSKFKES